MSLLFATLFSSNSTRTSWNKWTICGKRCIWNRVCTQSTGYCFLPTTNYSRPTGCNRKIFPSRLFSTNRDPSAVHSSTLFVSIVFVFPIDVVIFSRYKIRTNPSYFETPLTTQLYSSPASCRQSSSTWSQVFPIETGDSCPVNQYYYSGFIALQTLLDFAKIRVSLVFF